MWETQERDTDVKLESLLDYLLWGQTYFLSRSARSCTCSSVQTYQDTQTDLVPKVPQALEQLPFHRIGIVITATTSPKYSQGNCLKVVALELTGSCILVVLVGHTFCFKKHLHFFSSLPTCRTWGVHSLFCMLGAHPTP